MTNFTVSPTADGLLLRDYVAQAKTKLALPTTPYPERMTVRSVHSNYVSMSHSLIRITRGIGAHLWLFTLRYGPMTRAEFSPIEAFLESQRGRYRTFLFQPTPVYLTPQGTIAGSTPVVDGASQTGEAVRIRGLAASTTVLRAGDFLRFANHAKVYKAVEDVRSSSTGYAVVQLVPPLMASLADGEAININSPPFTVAQNNDTREFEIGSPGQFVFDVELIEVPKNG